MFFLLFPVYLNKEDDVHERIRLNESSCTTKRREEEHNRE